MHADEMKIKTKQEDWSWLQYGMDSEIRYTIANLITKHREEDDARKVFSIAKTHIRGAKPKLVITDGLV